MNYPQRTRKQLGLSDFLLANQKPADTSCRYETKRANIGNVTDPLPVLLCCAPGLDNFVDDWAAALKPQLRIDKLISPDGSDYIKALAGYDTVWLEWGNELAAWLTTQAADHLKGKRVLLRIHSYEVLDSLADFVNFRLIDDLIFVAPHIRDILLERKQEVARQVERIHLVPNGVDLKKFTLIERPRGFNLAFLGQLNFKKDPMLVLHAFAALHRKDPRYTLHIGGDLGQLRYKYALENFIQNNELADAIHIYGRVDQVPQWLTRMDYIVCSSLMEGHPVGLSEAMAMGLKPLIYQWPGADKFYPPDFMWQDVDSFLELVDQHQPPQRIREFIELNYSIQRQAESISQIIMDKKTVVFDGYRDVALKRPQIPPECYSLRANIRGTANKKMGLNLFEKGFKREAQTFYRRALAQSQYMDIQTLNKLLEVNVHLFDWEGATQDLKNVGFAAAARGDYEFMLQAFYLAYYFAYTHTKNYCWMTYDSAIDTVLRMTAPCIQPKPGFQSAIEGIDSQKHITAIALEGFDYRQAPVREFVDLARDMDKTVFEVLLLTRLEPKPEWQETMDILRQSGCRLLCAPGQAELPKLAMALYALNQVKCDSLILQTPWLIPWINLLGCCRPAKTILHRCHQEGGLEISFDQVMLLSRRVLMEQAVDAADLKPYCDGMKAPVSRDKRVKGKLRALVVGRQVKLQHRYFWRTLLFVLDKVPEFEIKVAGATADEINIPGLRSSSRINFLGFRDNIHELMEQADIVIDTWPAGGGAVIREAAAVGVPVISFASDCYHPSQVHKSKTSHVLNQLICPDLLLPEMDKVSLMNCIKRLVDEPDFYQSVVEKLSSMEIPRWKDYVSAIEQNLLVNAESARER